MLRNSLRWTWANRKKTALAIFLLLVVAINAITYMHARAMTRFAHSGTRTLKPEELSLGQKLEVLLTGVNIPRPENAVAPDAAGLPFITHRFPSGDGIELEAWYIPRPKSKSVVLMFHGYSASKTQLLGDARGFHELGYDVFLVDFRGSGGSAGNETTIGVFEAEDVAGAYERVRKRWPKKQVVLFGHSMGSAAILRALAVNDIRPDAVILESPFDRLLSTVENRFASMSLPSFPCAHLLVFWGGVQNDFNGFSHNPVSYAEHVTCPVLLLNGKDDVRVTQAQAEDVFSHLAGPKKLQLFDGVGHGSCHEANPREWKQAVGEFLEQYLGGKR